MHLREELLRGIYGYGFEKPSAIQQRAIAPCIKVSANNLHISINWMISKTNLSVKFDEDFSCKFLSNDR